MGSAGVMTPAKFIAKWSPVTLSERAASHEHFIDLCRLLGQPTPAEHDATGAEYTFDKGVKVTAPASKGSKGESGFADVWWRGKFGWEYKRKDKHKDLVEAYRQLCQYREDLENPPLLIVCDITTTEIHTNFTGTAKQIHRLALADLDRPGRLNLLRRVFTAPDSFRPDVTKEYVTKEVAEQIGMLAQSLQNRGHSPHEAAHFLMKCMFCLFAEDIRLLPDDLFTRLLKKWKDTPGELTGRLTGLFEKMRTGGAFGTDRIAWFNGGLFDESPALPLTRPEVGDLLLAAKQDWSSVEPAIFGTLFERSLDPSKRAQIGAHYTGRDDIMLVIEPVIMMPLRRQWEAVQENVQKQLARRRKVETSETKKKADQAISGLLYGFMDTLAKIRILDPACGSGNFLYVAIQELLLLEKEVIRYASQREIGLGGMLPTVRPTQLHGIEINPYATELAQVVIWIGYLQWMQDNGFNVPRDPILEPLQTVKCRDAILSFEESPQTVDAVGKDGDVLKCGQPAPWPDAHFIIGNPPFLGSKLFRQYGLPEEYVEAMYRAYDIPNASDLCCYWFERARQQIQFSKKYGGKGFGLVPYGFGPAGMAPAQNVRVGLLATQGIRGGANREVLKHIKETGDIFMAKSDREWILDGAEVHVSIVAFDTGREKSRDLDGGRVEGINTDLTGALDIVGAAPLSENTGLCFQGPVIVGPFDISVQSAREMLAHPNPRARPNTDVVRPVVNARDLTGRSRGRWIVDFGSRPVPEAALYESPFEYVRQTVKPDRDGNADKQRRERWWQHGRAGTEVRAALRHSARQLLTPGISKFRIFCWRPAITVMTNAGFVFAREDDYFFGVLHSSIHELWALRQGTQLESRPRYTPTTCFETFPLPWPPGEEPEGNPIHQRISESAKALDEQRERWVNPPEWIDPIARQVDAMDNFADAPEEARPLIRQSAIMALAATDKDLKQRTLTNLYNARPTWLKLAHLELDRAVLAAYAAVDPEGDWAEDWAEVWEDSGAGQPLAEDHHLAAKRAELDQMVLANLLRLNLSRSSEEVR